MPDRAIAIIRVSQRDETAQSPEKQARELFALAARSPWTLDPNDVWDENIDERGQVRRTASGGAALSDRPVFLRAVEAVERGEASVICAERLDRLFRDLDVQREVIRRVEAAGGRIETVAGRTSHETAELELQANLSGSVAQYVKRTAKERSMAAVNLAIEQSKVPWSQTPPGYIRASDSTLAPDPKLRSAIVAAFELRAAGATVADVRSHLAKHGVRKSYHGTIHLLRDRLYIGEIHFKNRANLDAHPAIVDRELFERVQRVKKARGHRATSDRLLARLGILRCASCGGRMVVGTQTQHGRSYPFYRCGHVREDCKQRVAISAELVERVVVDAIQLAMDSLESEYALSDRASTNRRRARLDLERARANYEAAMTAMSDFTDAIAVAKIKELKVAVDDCRARVDQLGHGRSQVTLTDDWNDLSLDQQRDHIRALIESVTVAPGRGESRVTIQFYE
jgi:DNA invertase Pin-like site-specific DNA recombinase